MRLSNTIPSAVVTACLVLGCSSSDKNGGNGAGGAGYNPNSNNTGGTGNNGAGVLAGVDGQRPGAGSTVTPVRPGDECAGTSYVGKPLPLDMLIMMDRSVSMGDSDPKYMIPGGGTKWVEARKGFASFFSLPQSAGLGVGIDFFGQGTCDVQAYATPEVVIQPLPDVAAGLLGAYDAQSPGGDTPMGPALEGALTYAKSWAQTHADHTVIVVLATDGAPHGCGAELTPSDVLHTSVDTIAKIPAAYAAGAPPIRTFVLGIEGQEVTVDDFRYAANTIATAGNGQAIIVEANDNLATEFSAALDTIRGTAAPPCDYSVPLPANGETLDLTKVNVVLLPNGSAPEGILNVPVATQCDYGGWYYDPPQAPVSIKLCPKTCDVVSRLDGAGFEVLFGCATQTIIY